MVNLNFTLEDQNTLVQLVECESLFSIVLELCSRVFFVGRTRFLGIRFLAIFADRTSAESCVKLDLEERGSVNY